MKVEIDEPDRQTILLALAELAQRRPGWYNYLEGLANSFEPDPTLRRHCFADGHTTGGEMFRNFYKMPGEALAQALKGP